MLPLPKGTRSIMIVGVTYFMRSTLLSEEAGTQTISFMCSRGMERT